jgi:hypothetical protein
VEQALKGDPQWYVKQRQGLTGGPLEKGWEEIPNHPLVWEVQWKPPNWGRIIFYPLPLVYCPHGRYRKTCVTIRAKIERLKRLQHTSAAGMTIGKATVDQACDGIDQAELRAFATVLRRGSAQKLTRELKEQGVDPERATPEDFCQYRAPNDRDLEEDDKWWTIVTDKHPRPAHRPRKRGFDFLVISDLTKAGWTVMQSCEFLNNVLHYCFGISDESTENLRQRWYRSNKRWQASQAKLQPLLKDGPSIS